MIRFLIELTFSSPNMVRTVRRTILRNEMQASTQTRQKPSRQHDPKCRLNQVKNHPSQGNSTNYHSASHKQGCTSNKPTILLLFLIPPKRMKCRASPSSIFIFYFFLIHRRALCFQPVRDKIRRTGRIFPEHVERSFLDPEYSSTNTPNYIREVNVCPVKNQLCSPNIFQGWQILRTTLPKQMFAQLRTGRR